MKLKELRTKRNLTQQQVADHIGCSAVVYSRYENGVRQPSIEVLLRLADLFGVSVDALLGMGGGARTHDSLSPRQVRFQLRRPYREECG